MLLAVFFFSLMNLGVRLLNRLPTHEVVFFRSLFAVGMTLMILRYMGILTLGNNRKLLFLRGFFGAAGQFFFFITLQKIPFATAVTLQNLSPIFVSILAVLLLGERLRFVQFLFFLVSFSGVVLIRGFDSRVSAFYLMLSILAAIASSLAYTMIRLMRDSDHPMVVVLYFPLISLPIAAVWCLFDFVMPQPLEWLILFGTACTAMIAQVLMTRSLYQEKIISLSALSYVGVLFSIFYDYLLLSGHYPPMAIAGMALVLLGVLGNIFLKAR